jgi:hypothetical protein
MNRAFIFSGILACSFLPASGAAQDVSALDENLQFLAPLIGPVWEGGFVGEETENLVILLRFEPALSGRVVKYTREVAELGYSSETLFYWHPTRGEVLVLALNSRGMVGEGVVSVEGGEIILQGVDHRPDGPLETRTVLRVDEEGVLRDTFYRMEGGEWVQGHLQEFIVRDDGPRPHGGA